MTAPSRSSDGPEANTSADARSTTGTDLPPLKTALENQPVPVQQLAFFHYGQQLEHPVQPLSRSIRGRFATSDIVRRYQLNRYVTSGVTPMGLASDFDQRFQQLSRQARVALDQLGPCIESASLTDILVTRAMPIKDAIMTAATLAARIRGDQTLLDGNHRTALLSFVMSLAESSVILRPNFSIYRAYIILSARDHPGNVNNLLDSQARTDVARALYQYSRTRVKPGPPDWVYLDIQAERIRHLPVYAAEVEATYRRLGIRREDYREPQMKNRLEQREAWRGLEGRLRADILFAYPAFHPGAPERLQPSLQPYPFHAFL